MSVDKRAQEPTTETQIIEFNSFFRNHLIKLIAALVRYGAPRLDAEDAVQHGMMQLARHLSNVGNSDGERFAYAKIAAIRYYTAGREAASKERSALAKADWHRPEPSGDTSKVDSEQHVLHLLRQLPPKQQLTVALWVDGHTPTEIAQLLDQPASTVSSNLRHALNKLRDKEGG